MHKNCIARSRGLCAASCGTVVLCALVLVAGCGGGGEAEPQSFPGATEQILSREDVERVSGGTAQRALFEWWRAAQYADRSGFLAAYAPPVRRRLERHPKLAEALDWFSGAVRPARPRVESVERRGQRVNVYAVLEFRSPIGLTRYITTTKRQVFAFVWSSSQWLLADDQYFRATIPANLRSEEP